MAGTPGSTPYLSYEAFAGLKYHTPFYAHDFHPGGLCKWRSIPRSTPTSVMRLLRVWSIIPLFTHMISTRVVWVNGRHSGFYPLLELWGFCGFEVLHPFLGTWFPPRWFVVWSIVPIFTHTISTRVVCVNGEAPPVLPRTSVMRLLQVWSRPFNTLLRKS